MVRLLKMKRFRSRKVADDLWPTGEENKVGERLCQVGEL
jgi:hypothetical protein